MSDQHDLDSFAEGIYALTALIRPIYGPSGKVVAHAGATGRSAPELLTDGATIARRLTEVDHRVENAGMMFLRGLLWEVHERVGDGTSTTAIVFDAMYREGRKGITAGLNAARLRDFLFQFSTVLHLALEQQRVAVANSLSLERLAKSVSGDEALAKVVSEIVTGLGAHGHVEVRPSRVHNLGYEFLGDSFWPSKCLDTTMLLGMSGRRLDLMNCGLFVSDLPIEDPHMLISILAAARTSGVSSLIILGRSLSTPCLGLLMSNSSPAFPIMAMRTPETTPIDQLEAMEDIATITGAFVFHEAAGATAANIKPTDLGSCRRAWVSRTHLGLFGGKAPSQGIRQRIRSLRTDIQVVSDDRRKNRLRLRLSRLSAKSAIIWINGVTDREIEQRKRLAERTCHVAGAAISTGGLPGGGSALLACHRLIDDQELTTDEPEEAFAIRMLMCGLEAPVRTLAQNLGLEFSWAVAKAIDAGPGKSWNMETAQIIDTLDVELLDSFEVVATALQHAVNGAAQALTIQSIVLQRTQKIATAP